jgi:serine phosphatase RsbU (regulator of sigma subunit)
MDETIRRLDNPDFYITALLARWRAATATLTWVNCGHPNAYLVDGDGELAELEATQQRPLGTSREAIKFTPTSRQLHPGERLILLTDGVVSRRIEGGGKFGVEGLIGALERADNPTAASTAMAIQQAVTDSWREPLEDDATVVVMAID